MLEKANKITSCYLGPHISPENFISEHFFLFLAKGSIQGFDGHQKYDLQSGESCLVRKNHLVSYKKQKIDGEFEKVVVVFDEPFLKTFQSRHKVTASDYSNKNAFFLLKKDELIPNF